MEPYRTLLEPMWQEAQHGNPTIISSRALIVEALVKPMRKGGEVVVMLL